MERHPTSPPWRLRRQGLQGQGIPQRQARDRAEALDRGVGVVWAPLEDVVDVPHHQDDELVRLDVLRGSVPRRLHRHRPDALAVSRPVRPVAAHQLVAGKAQHGPPLRLEAPGQRLDERDLAGFQLLLRVLPARNFTISSRVRVVARAQVEDLVWM